MRRVEIVGLACGIRATLLLLAVLAQTHGTILGYRLHLDFEPAWQAVGESYFLALRAFALRWTDTGARAESPGA